MEVILFSRPIRSGKTTELLHWKNQHSSVRGIAMPDATQGRFMLDLSSGVFWQAQCLPYIPSETKRETVGSFSFYVSAFERANAVLVEQAMLQPDWLVIDEIGKLELRQKGFYSGLISILQTRKPNALLLVVRDSLLSDVIATFKLSAAKVVHCLDELT